jgi:drug/metabolite transporter (DMT)-like permease
MPTWAGDAMALACALAWAGAVTLFRKLGAVEPAALNLFKNTVALVLLSVTMLASSVPFDTGRSPSDWAMLLGSGVLGLAIADTMFLAGLRRIDASIAAVCDCAYSPTVVLLSATFLGERLGGGLLLGGGLVVVGLFVVSSRSRPSTDDASASPNGVDLGGVLLATGGVVTTALGVVLAKPVLDRSSVLEATTLRLAAGTVSLFASQVAIGRAREALVLFRPQIGWRVAIPATLLGTYVSMLLWLGGMKYGTASRTALLNQMGAIFVLVLSRFAGEVVPLRRWVGAGVAVLGVCVVLVG